MIINFLYFFIFLISFSSLGQLFNSYYYNNKDESKDLLNPKNIISSIFVFGFILVLVNFFVPIDSIIIKIFF